MANDYNSVVLGESALVSFWRPGASLGDLKGSNGGTAFGAPATGVASFDGLPDALGLDGATQYASVPNDPSLAITGNFSLEAWVKPATATTGLYSAVVTKGYSASTSPWCDYGLFIQGGGSTTTYLLMTIGGVAQYCGTPQTLATGYYHHLVGTYDGSHLKLYIDGVLAATLAATGAVATSGQALQFGRLPGGNFLNGDEDALAVYNGALSQTAVVSHYTAGAYGRGMGGRTSGDGNDASLNFGTGNPLAGASQSLVCCWVRAYGFTTAWQKIFSQVGASTGWQLYENSTGSYIAYNEPGTGSNPTGGPAVGVGWAHVAGLHNADGTMHLFFNGVDAANASGAGGSPFGGTNSLSVTLPNPNVAVAEPCVFANLTYSQAAAIAANLAAGRSPLAQTPGPSFYARFGAGGTEASLVGSYSAAVPANSAAVAGPAVDPPPNAANPCLLLLAG